MALDTINVGTVADDGTGDTLRAAFQKVNANVAKQPDLTLANTFAQGTLVASAPQVFSMTFNNAAVNFTGLSVDATDTASAGGSQVFRVRTGSTTVFSVEKSAGLWIVNSNSFTFTATALAASNARDITFTGTAVGRIMWNADLILGRYAAATLRLGDAAAASPVAQKVRAQDSRAGTDSNVGGANLTMQAGTGTGTGTPSRFIIQTPVAVASGSGAQTQTTGLEVVNGAIKLTSFTVATLPAGEDGMSAFVTDATLAMTAGVGTVVAGGGANKVPVYYDGDWRIG